MMTDKCIPGVLHTSHENKWQQLLQIQKIKYIAFHCTLVTIHAKNIANLKLG
jgi:hypothetical protein